MDNISVVSAYYKKEDMTVEFLDNLQKVTPKVEMILTNAGSRPIDHPFITKRVDLDHNESFSNSMNAAIKETTGDYVCVLGNDVFPEEGWLDSLVNLAKSTGAYITAPINDKTPLHQIADGKQFDTYFETDFFPAICWLLSRECLDTVGLFDEQFLEGCYEDNDYAKRVKKAGGKTVVDKTTSVKHLLSQTLSQFDVGKAMERNYKLYHQKWS